ncbi:hypothetical protein HW132_31035 [Brasilonema sp. CT11]|nr:hypothetical protein [Brasilonema sp. CT11]
MTTAKAHTRSNHAYSTFHNYLLADADKGYALQHIYSVEACRHLLKKWGWSEEDIKLSCEHIVIDVHQNFVYLKVPRMTLIKKGEPVKVRPLSRFVSKKDFVNTLIERAWQKSDPYKLQASSSWDEFVVMGNTGEVYELRLCCCEITCTCHAFSGLKKAFEQDPIANKILFEHPVTTGFMPDKHIFAVFKYLGVTNYTEYRAALTARHEAVLMMERERSLSISQTVTTSQVNDNDLALF